MAQPLSNHHATIIQGLALEQIENLERLKAQCAERGSVHMIDDEIRDLQFIARRMSEA